ncbi:hypothetical protein BH10PSE17_BH10PSE17_29760 [soil metagenome]
MNTFHVALITIACTAPLLVQAQSADSAAKIQQLKEQMASRFNAADVDHDGRLTKAEAARMPRVAKNFDAIDKAGRGYVTQDDITAYAMAMAAERGKLPR